MMRGHCKNNNCGLNVILFLNFLKGKYVALKYIALHFPKHYNLLICYLRQRALLCMRKREFIFNSKP